MTAVDRYDATAETDRFVATLGDQHRLPVTRSRARGYPGLDSPAPATGPVYRIAQRVLKGRRAIVDVGCGSAAGSQSLVAPGVGVIGVDPSEEAIAFAHAYAPGILCVLGSVDQLEETDRFSGAVIVDVLGLVADPVKILIATRRRLDPEALVMIAEARASLDQRLIVPARHAYTSETLESLLVRGGFVAEAGPASPSEFIVLNARPTADLRASDALALADSPGVDPARAIEQVSLALATVEDPCAARELLLAFGQLHLGQGDLDSAAGTFVGALRLAPRSARGLTGLGTVAERVGRPGEALRLYEKATQNDPLAPEGWRALGALRATTGAKEGAITALRNAAILAPAEAHVVEAFIHAAGASVEATEARRQLDAYAAPASV